MDEQEITLNYADLKEIRDELIFEREEYDGDVAKDFVIIHDTTFDTVIKVLEMMIIQSEIRTSIK